MHPGGERDEARWAPHQKWKQKWPESYELSPVRCQEQRQG